LFSAVGIPVLTALARQPKAEGGEDVNALFVTGLAPGPAVSIRSVRPCRRIPLWNSNWLGLRFANATPYIRTIRTRIFLVIAGTPRKQREEDTEIPVDCTALW
jgi:hypothetical protein